MAKKKSGLGKGLSALIRDDIAPKQDNMVASNGYMPHLAIDAIVPNPYQPRTEMKPEKLVELADSVREHGIIEPLLVTKSIEQEAMYELIAGERRWRAAQLAGLTTVPAVLKEATPQDMLELAVIENLQREDLSPLEEALAFDQLRSVFKLTLEDVSKRVGLSRPSIANKIRLLELPDEVKKALLDEEISEGHARALLSLKSAEAMIATYKVIIRDNLSVRAVEELVRRLNKGDMKVKKGSNRILDDRTLTIESDLKHRFGEKVTFYRSKKGGKITIPFKSENELDGILRLMLE